MAAYSEFWGACFSSNMKEEVTSEVDLMDTYEVAKAILDWIYDGQCVVDNWSATLELAHRWDVAAMLEVLTNTAFQTIGVINLDSVGDIWLTAEHLDLKDLVVSCTEFCVEQILSNEKVVEDGDAKPQDSVVVPNVSVRHFTELMRHEEIRKNRLLCAKVAVAYVDRMSDDITEKEVQQVFETIPWAAIADMGEQGVSFFLGHVFSNPRVCKNGQVPVGINSQLLGMLFLRLATAPGTLEQVQQTFKVAAKEPAMLSYEELQVGMKVVVTEDPEQLRRLCLRPAPNAKHPTGWTGSVAPLCGQSFEIAGLSPDVRAVKLAVGFGVWYLPFDSVRALV
jgi:hypothetical protein